MNIVSARNVNQALPLALELLSAVGKPRASRNGPVLYSRNPTTTIYEKPAERVVFWPERDANPFFHLYESLWMLGGRDDVESLASMVPRMRSFSDDGTTLHGAYGHRWRHHFKTDQLDDIVNRLRRLPDDRRCVLSMWDARSDLDHDGRDVPCNLLATFQISDSGRLDMMVANRSNDVVWGCYGANAVHFSVLQEYVATSVGVPVGIYWQVSANWHGYLNTFEPLRDSLLTGLYEFVSSSGDSANNLVYAVGALDPYAQGVVAPYPLMSEPREQWDRDLKVFLQTRGLQGYYRDPFFTEVAAPMAWAHTIYKQMAGEDKFDATQERLSTVMASDWRRAAIDWVERRRAKWNREKDDGVTYDG